MSTTQRGTIFQEQAAILQREAFADGQHLLRLHAPQTAAQARAGSFVHLRPDPQRPLRRPISIMRVEREAGWIELFYKAVGQGTQLLSQQAVGQSIDLLGPIGRPFSPSLDRPRPLLLGGGVGMPPMVFLADELRRDPGYQPLVLLGSESPFPFPYQRSGLPVPGVPEGTDGCMPLLEQWGIASRLSSRNGLPGSHAGFVTDLARSWLEALGPERQEVELFACGPHPMLEAVARLAREFDLPCQISMEEFMACGVGGCAGCVVEIQTEQGPAMKRVCVDGPVFDARTVFG